MTFQNKLEDIGKRYAISTKHKTMLNFLKSKITNINLKSAYLFIKLATDSHFNNTTAHVKVKDILPTQSVINKNKRLFDDDGIYFKEEFIKSIVVDYGTLHETIRAGNNIQEISEQTHKDLFKQLDGKGNNDTRVPTMDATYTDLEKYMCDNGSESNFMIPFKKKSPTIFETKSSVQIMEVAVSSKGEDYTHPLRYNYTCSICGAKHNKPTYEVHSTNNNTICDNVIITETDQGKLKRRTCNRLLSPIKNMVETKTMYFCNGTYKTENNNIQNCVLTSEHKLPLGNLVVAVVQVPTEYNKVELYVIDYKPLEKNIMIITNTEKNKVLSLIEDIDTHIFNVQHYKHYGYTPMKIAMLLQCGARYLDRISNNFNMMLVGGASVGKTIFSEMWGSVMYGPSFFTGSAGTISIPMLRGTMEKIRIHNKEFYYQTYGMLGEKDLIAIDELREEQNLKSALKPFMRSPEYSYAKAGGSSQLRIRTAQMIVTENINIIHLQHYRNKVKKYYNSDIVFTDNNDVVNTELWNDEWDLELPLYKIKNKKLQYAIHQVRTSFIKSGTNWIDGEDSAADDRFVFFFFISNDKSSQGFNNLIKQNSQDGGSVYNKTELARTLYVNNIKDMFVEMNNENGKKESPFIGENENEYIDKVTPLLKKHNLSTSPRTIDDFISMLKLVRMINKRKSYNESDIKIIEYMMQNIKSKIEITDTLKFEIKPTSTVLIPKMESNGLNDYKNNLNLF